jgi:1-acyl-sn-glycerol-3-phosphate acyltransferase
MQKLFKPINFLWHVWFYITIIIAILVLFPFIFVSSLTPKWYRSFFFFARIWAWIVLVLTGFWPRIKWNERPDPKGQYIIAPNHSSMIDIMLTLAIFPNCFLFIGKKELASMPLFGYFYKRTNLLVDRKSMRSRIEVFEKASKKIEEGYGVCVFPEGLVPRDQSVHLADFKNGAFKLSAENNIPIIPVTYYSCKRMMPFNWFRGYPGVLRGEVHSFLHPEQIEADVQNTLKRECYTVIFEALKKDPKYV